MTQREDLNNIWKSKWESGQTRWQMNDVHLYLKLYFHKMIKGEDTFGRRILVPLCGATPDLSWLYQQGLTVVGIELSDVAIKTFFEDNNLSFTVEERSSGKVYSHDERLKIFQFDIFDLDVKELEGSFDYWWDRGGLVAMILKEQRPYVEKICAFMSSSACSLIEVVEYDNTIEGGPPESISNSRLTELLGDQFVIEELNRVTEDELPDYHSRIGLNSLRVNYLLSRK